MQLNLDDSEFWQLMGALDAAKNKYGEDRENMLSVAEYMREGNPYPMFANPQAAVHLAEQFGKQQDDMEKLKEKLLDAYDDEEECY